MMTSAVERVVEKNNTFNDTYGSDIVYAPDFTKMMYVAKNNKTNKLEFNGEFSLVAIYKKTEKLLLWECCDPYAPELCRKKAPDVSVLHDGSSATMAFRGPGVQNVEANMAFCLVAFVFDHFGGESLVSIDNGNFLYYLALNSVNKY